MERMYFDNAGIDSRILEEPEQPLAVCVELLLGIPHLEHPDLILTVGGVHAAAVGVAAPDAPSSPSTRS